MRRGFQNTRRHLSVILMVALILTLLPVQGVKAEEPKEVTLEMCDELSNKIDALAEIFAYNTDTKDKLVAYRKTYNQYLYWDELYEKNTTKDAVRNEEILTQMEEAYQMMEYLDECYTQVEPFEELTDYYDVSAKDFRNFEKESKNPDSPLTKFVGHFTGASEEILAFFGKEGTAVSVKHTNMELGKTVEAVYLFVENNSTVFEGVSLVYEVLAVAPETGDIVKATYDNVNSAIVSLGNWKESFDENGSDSQKSALDRRIVKIFSGKYQNFSEFYDTYLTHTQKIGFEKRIDDLYEEISSTMDYTTLSSDNRKISEVENDYMMLSESVQNQIVNVNMLQELRKKYNENLEYYNQVVKPAIEVSDLIEADFWKLYDLKWPGCADAELEEGAIVEKNLIEADTIIQHAMEVYESLTFAQKKHVTTVSYLDYMKKTYQTMNLRYMTTAATTLYPLLDSNLLLAHAKATESAYLWLNRYVTQEDLQTLQSTLVDPECESSDVVSVISVAAKQTATFQQNMGRETEKAIRNLVTMQGNTSGLIQVQEIESVYERYQQTLSDPTAAKELTDISKYQIEALHTLVLLIDQASEATENAAAISLVVQDNVEDFVRAYKEALQHDNAFEEEFTQLQKDFTALENGSVCLTDSTKKALRCYEGKLAVLKNRKDILDVYDSIGAITVLDKSKISEIHEAWEAYIQIVGEETQEDVIFAGIQIQHYETMANHVETFLLLCDLLSDSPQTEEDKEAIVKAETYYQNTLTEQERDLIPQMYVSVLQNSLSQTQLVQEIIDVIDAIVIPTEDVSYAEFVTTYGVAKSAYDSYLKLYPQGAVWIQNADRLEQYGKAADLIVKIKELLQVHTSQMCENKANIADAITEYEDLQTETQDMVYNYPLIYSLYNDVVQADYVRTLLSQLVVLTLAKEQEVIYARNAYDSLSERGKQYVNNAILLSLAEKQIAALKQNEAQALKEQQSNLDITESSDDSSGKDDGTETASGSVEKKSIKKAVISGLAVKYKVRNRKKCKKLLKKLKKGIVVKMDGSRLKQGKDYTVQVKKNKKQTRITFVLKGKGLYKQKKKVRFKIVYSKKV